jgi:hypothetical protein
MVSTSKIVYSGDVAFVSIKGFDNVTYIRPVTDDDFSPLVVYRNGICQRCAQDSFDCGCLEQE